MRITIASILLGVLFSIQSYASEWHWIMTTNPFEGKPVNLMGQIEQTDFDTLNAGYDKPFFVRINKPTSWDPVQGFSVFGKTNRNELQARGKVLLIRSIDIVLMGEVSDEAKKGLDKFWQGK